MFMSVYTHWLLLSNRRLKAEIVMVPEFAFSGEGQSGIKYGLNRLSSRSEHYETQPCPIIQGLTVFNTFILGTEFRSTRG